MRGKFITFEGCEGVGKSTQVRLLKEYFEACGKVGLFTREPGGTSISERIREIILDVGNTEMYAETELLLYEAARYQHTREVIIPALESGITVICDRYIDSTTAYQAFARGLDRKKVEWLNDFACAGAQIDATIYLDAQPFANTSRRGGDRLELAGEDFHNRVYGGFKTLSEASRFIVVPTDCDKLQTHRKIIEKLAERGLI